MEVAEILGHLKGLGYRLTEPKVRMRPPERARKTTLPA